MPYPVLQSVFDALYPPGLQWYWRADFFREITDQAIAVHAGVRRGAAHPALDDAPVPDRRRGAPGQPGRHRVRLPGRGLGGVIVGVDPDPANAGKIRDWAVRYWEALHPTSAGGAYVNFMMDEGADRVRASYGPNYDRLARIKAQLRPGELLPRSTRTSPAR